MIILVSIAITDRLDLLGIAPRVSESCIAVELQDGSLHTFDACGQPLRVFKFRDDEAFNKTFQSLLTHWLQVDRNERDDRTT